MTGSQNGKCECVKRNGQIVNGMEVDWALRCVNITGQNGTLNDLLGVVHSNHLSERMIRKVWMMPEW